MAPLPMVHRYATLVPSSEGGITPRPPCRCAAIGRSIRPELDQFWCTFLLTYLLLNLDKKHTPQQRHFRALRPGHSRCRAAAHWIRSVSPRNNPNFSSLNPAAYWYVLDPCL